MEYKYHIKYENIDSKEKRTYVTFVCHNIKKLRISKSFKLRGETYNSALRKSSSYIIFIILFTLAGEVLNFHHYMIQSAFLCNYDHRFV